MNNNVCRKLKQDGLVTNLYIIIQYMLIFYYMLYGSHTIYLLSIGLGGFGLVYSIVFPEDIRNDIKVFVSILIALFMTCNVILVGNFEWTFIFYEIFVFFSTALMLTREKVNRKTCLILFFIIAFIMLFRLMLTDNAKIFYNASRNYVSVVAINLLFPFYSTFSKDDDPSIIPALMCFILCVLSYGRGGIISGALLMLGMSLKSMIQRKKVSRLNGFISFVCLCLIIYTIFFSDQLNQYLYWFNEAGMKSSRTIIWGEYLATLTGSVGKMLFGGTANSTHTLVLYANNLHNSFLMTHFYMGLIGFLGTIFIFIRGLKYCIRHSRWTLVVFVLVFIIRSFTDWLFPLQMGSIVVYYLLLLPTKRVGSIADATNKNVMQENRIMRE